MTCLIPRKLRVSPIMREYVAFHLLYITYVWGRNAAFEPWMLLPRSLIFALSFGTFDIRYPPRTDCVRRTKLNAERELRILPYDFPLM